MDPFMTSILQSDATLSIGFIRCFLICIACFGAPALSTEEDAPIADDAVLEDARYDLAPDAQADPAGDARKPWLITPTLSADPKLGANVGGLLAYVKKLDAESTPSMLGLSVSYSDTDSSTRPVWPTLLGSRHSANDTVVSQR